MADLFGAIKDAWGANEKEKAAKKDRDAARQSRQQGMDLAAGMDYEPDLVSDHLAPYQRAKSPVADAFLDSFLTGSNPAAVQSTRAGSGRQKYEAQQAFDQNYGGWDKLRAEQAQLQQSTPWQVKPFQSPVVSAEQRHQGAKPFLAKQGVSPEDEQLLTASGVVVDPVTGGLRKGGALQIGGLTGLGAGIRPDVFTRNPQLLGPFTEAWKSGDRTKAVMMLVGE